MNRIIAGPLMGLLAIFCLIFSSCQKELDIDLDNPPPIPEELSDSILLIKSIACILNDGRDSVVEHYAYDTVNREITLTWTFHGLDVNDPNYVPELVDAKTKLSYNNEGLLIRAEYTHSPHLPPSDGDYAKTEILYDEENIVQKIILSYRNSPADVRDFEKISFPDGRYTLDWEEPTMSSDHSDIFRTTLFSPDGRAEANGRVSFSLTSDPIVYELWLDSILYDANGNVERVLTRKYDEYGNLIEDYVSVEYADRESKGDQFFNQRKLLLNGISEIPVGVYEEILNGSMGTLSRYLEFEAKQFSRFPARNAKIRLSDGSYQEYQPVYTFDSKDRLSLLTCYFLEPDLHPVKFRIHYFK